MLHYLKSEVHSALGRCDAIVETKTHVYAFEFKLDQSANEALLQIKDKNYLGPYAASHRILVAVGINFSSDTRAVNDFLIAEIEGA